MRWVALVLPVLHAIAGPAVGQDVGNPEAGLILAGEICSDCHAVEAGVAVSPLPEAPSFQAIARKPEMSALALTVFFQSTHPSMPDLIVTGNDARDLTAYLLSLKP